MLLLCISYYPIVNMLPRVTLERVRRQGTVHKASDEGVPHDCWHHRFRHGRPQFVCERHEVMAV